MKRVPVYLSVEEMGMLISEFNPDEWSDPAKAQKLLERIQEEIERNKDPEEFYKDIADLLKA